MKKRIVALGLVLVMLVTSALAVYPKKDIVYERPDLVHMTLLSEQMEDVLKETGALNRIVSLYSEMQSEYEYIYTMYSLAMLQQYQRVDSKLRAAEVSTCYSVLIDAHELMRSTMVMMFESQYEEVFREAWGDAVVDSILASDPMTDEERAVEEKIAAKLSEYVLLLANPSAVIDGKRVALSSAKTKDLRDKIYSLWQREMGEIYLELVSLRKQLADGENFLAESYQGYYREYSLQNARALEDMVADALGVVYEKVGRTFDAKAVEELDFEMSMTELVDLTAPVLATVDKSLSESYKVMKENELYDIEQSDHKANMGFTITLPSYETPFLFVQPGNQVYGLTTFYHEFGHFNQMLNSDMHAYWPGTVTDLDAMEVASQALPLMIGDGLGTYLGEDGASMMSNYSAEITLFALVSACAVDEFEQFVYATDDLTVDLLNEKFGELCEKYHIAWDDMTWTQINHIFESPGYYISYAVSAITAMEIWEQFETDPAAGKESYLKAVEACPEGYRTLLANAKLRNPFSSPELITKLRNLIEKEFSLLVDTYGHWAEEKVDTLAGLGVVSGYLGSDGKYYFRPNQNVTRAEFVKLLYGLTGGSDETYTEPFDDVKDTDWFAPYVAWASANGLVNGVDAVRFNPNGTISRQDMAVILERFLALKKQKLPSDDTVSFTDDAQIAGYARYAVERLSNANILNGLPDGSFNPRGSVTRAAAATALYTTLEVVASETEQANTTEKNSAPIMLPQIPVQAKLLSMMVH